MKNLILKFNDFSKTEKIYEFSEFSDTRAMSGGNTTDPSLSVNAFDRHEDSIRVGMSRVNNIMKSLSNSSAYRSLKSKLTFENQRPSSIKILRIIPNNVDYYVYLTTTINEMEYDGVIKNILSKNPQLNSNIFKSENLVQSEEWEVRLKGLIVESIKKWLNSPPNTYNILNEQITCINLKTGELKTLSKGNVIEVLRTSINENKITIKHDSEVYNLTKDNFVYFNYWFEKN